MLFLVRIPSLPKRIQQNAESKEQAIQIIFDSLPDRFKNGLTIQDCSAIELENPMMQFTYSGAEFDDGSI